MATTLSKHSGLKLYELFVCFVFTFKSIDQISTGPPDPIALEDNEIMVI